MVDYSPESLLEMNESVLGTENLFSIFRIYIIFKFTLLYSIVKQSIIISFIPSRLNL